MHACIMRNRTRTRKDKSAVSPTRKRQMQPPLLRRTARCPRPANGEATNNPSTTIVVPLPLHKGGISATRKREGQPTLASHSGRGGLRSKTERVIHDLQTADAGSFHRKREG